MSIEIDVNSIHTANTDTVIHSIPCEIELNGEAKVDQYFTTAQRTVTEGGEKCEHQTNTWLIYFFALQLEFTLYPYLLTHTHLLLAIFTQLYFRSKGYFVHIFGNNFFLLI